MSGEKIEMISQSVDLEDTETKIVFTETQIELHNVPQYLFYNKCFMETINQHRRAVLSLIDSYQMMDDDPDIDYMRIL